jgi:hypothetical protein
VLGAGLIFLLSTVSPGRSGMVFSAAAFSAAAAMVLTHRLRTGYVHALERSLVDRAVALDPALVRDSRTSSLLLRTTAVPWPETKSDLPAQRPAQTDDFVRITADLRSGDPARVRAAAREALQRMGPKITGMMINVLLDPKREFAIRRRLPRVLAYIPSSRSVEGLLAAVGDRRFEARFYAARALSLILRDQPDLAPPSDRIWAVVNGEVDVHTSERHNRRLLDARDSRWYFDEELRDRAGLNLEHLFTLLSLALPVEAVRIAFRALHTTDRQLRGAALEYLESATPPVTRRRLLNLLEAEPASRAPVAAPDALHRLLLSSDEVTKSLSLPAVAQRSHA